MNYARLTDPRIGRMVSSSKRFSQWCLLIGLIALGHAPTYAGDDNEAPQWNIMVVPANESVFSGEGRMIFNKHCASCHSEDGRAQTPQALKDGVQDLSECTLTDEGIVQQILHGTRNKPVAHKMPPFGEKLTAEQVESLVPLVKAFRPIQEESQCCPVRSPRLAGMLNGSLGQIAVFETEEGSGHYFILRKKESHGGVRLLKFLPRKGSVKLELAGTKKPVTFTLSNWASSHPKQHGVLGVLDSLGKSLNEAPSYLILDQVNTDLILFLYAQSTGRTLLCSPGLPETTFTLDLHSSRHIYISRKLRQALNDKGLASLKLDERFLLILPQAEVDRVTVPSPEIDSVTLRSDLTEPFPGGVIVNFRKANLRKILQLYSLVTARTYFPDPEIRDSHIAMDLTTQSSLNREECAHALETLLRLHGLNIKLLGSDSFTVTELPIHEPH